MKKILLTALSLLPFYIAFGNSNIKVDAFSGTTTPNNFSSVSVTPSTRNQFEKVEFDIRLNTNYTNPYNGGEILLKAYFIAPSGKSFTQYGFFYKEYEDRNPYSSNEVLDPTGDSYWKVRFCPTEAGNWRYRLETVDANGSSKYPTSGYYSFTVNSNINAKGFVEVFDKNYMKYSNGEVFIPIGANYGWYTGVFNIGASSAGTKEYIPKMQEMADNGINLLNTWQDMYGSLNIIGFDQHTGKSYYNYFNQEDSWRLDKIIEAAESMDMFLILTPFAHGNFNNYKYTSLWKEKNPYNAQNVTQVPSLPDKKGTCQTPFEFYTRKDGTRTQQLNLIRYYMSRWGYSTSLFALQTITEAPNIGTNGETLEYPVPSNYIAQIGQWQRDIKSYFDSEGINPYKHLLTIGWTDANLDADAFKYCDFSQLHKYTDYLKEPNYPDIGIELNGKCQILKEYFDKPATAIEYGYCNPEPVEFSHSVMDPNLYDLHCVNWMTVLSGSFSNALFWWWSDLFKLNKLDRYKGISNYVKQMKYIDGSFASRHIEQNGFRIVTLSDPDDKVIYGWMQDQNFMFRNLIDNHPNYLQNLSSDRPSNYASQNYSFQTKINVGQNKKYELKYYNTITGKYYSKSSNIYPINGKVTLYLYPFLRNQDFADEAFILSCKPSTGWVEYELCKGQWNSVNSLSELEASQSNHHIFYINSNKQVCCLYKKGNIFGDAILNSSAPTALSTRSLLYDKNNNILYYVAYNRKIYKLYYSSGWKFELANSSSNNLVGNDSELDITSGGGNIFFINTNNQVCILWKNGTSSGNVVLNNSAPRTLSKRGMVYDQSKDILYYTGQDRKIYKLYYSNGSWLYSIVCSGQWNYARSDSELELSPSGNHVFYVNTNNQVCALYKSGTTWGDAKLSSLTYGVKSNTDLTCIDGDIYFISSRNYVEKMYYTTQWNHGYIHQPDYCQQEASNGIIQIGDKICYIGSDKKIHYFTYNSVLKSTGESLENNNFAINLSEDFKNFQIYPNPASENITIKTINETTKDCKLVIFDINGKQISSSKINTEYFEMDISDLPKGVYFIKFLNDSFIECSKFIKE